MNAETINKLLAYWYKNCDIPYGCCKKNHINTVRYDNTLKTLRFYCDTCGWGQDFKDYNWKSLQDFYNHREVRDEKR